MNVRPLAKVANTTQADSAAKATLLKHAGVKSVEGEPWQKPEEWAKRNFDQKSNFKQDFSCIPVSSAPAPVVQPKLVVGRSDDRYEQEADRVAEQVMRMPEPITFARQGRSGLPQPLSIQRLKADTSKKLQRQVEESEESDEEETVQAKFLSSLSIHPLSPLSGERLQRQAGELEEAKPEDGEEEPVQAKFLSPLPIQSLKTFTEERLQRQGDGLQEAQPEDEEEEEPVQTKGIPQRTPTVTQDLASRLRSSRGGGQPLSASIREFMESRFNHDFSQVRVHTDGQANQLARGLNAQAFTYKQDVYFGAGYYQPHTSSGKRLLAHELTHTIQQQSHPLPKPHNPLKSPASLGKTEPELDQVPEKPSFEKSSDKVASLSLIPSIANSVPEAQGVISRRVAKPAEPPVVLTPELMDRLADEGELEGLFVPPGMQETPAGSEATASKQAKTTGTPPAKEATEGKEAPKEESEEKPEDPSAAKAEGEDAEAVEEAATEKSPTSPEEDPAFQAVVKQAKGIAKQQQQHAPARAESKKALDAAVPPKNEVESQAQDRQVQDMDQQQPGTFDAKKFVAALLEKIRAITPKTEDEAKEFKKNNKINSVKQEVSSQVSQEKEKSTDPIAKKTKEAPDKTGIQPKPVTPLQPPAVGAKPVLKADQAAPKPKTEVEVSEPFKQNSEELDQQMTDAGVKEKTLAESNEPEFTAALDAKKDAQTDAETAPDAYRKDEQGVLNRAEEQAQDTSQKQTEGMHGQREKLLTQAMDQQKGIKGRDEADRTRVANDINRIYAATKADVERILNSLDTEVNNRFDAGAKTAKKAFEDYVDKEMDAYKEKRYGAWYDVRGWGTRLGDAWSGLPPEVNIIFVKGRELYTGLMETTLNDIAEYVANELNTAKERIAEGKKQIQPYVASLSPEDAQNIQDKFDALEDQVNSKQDELIDSLTQKYQENLKAIDEDIKKRKEANKGLKQKAKDKIKGVIETIRKLKQMFDKVLARISEVAALIINDPIGFLKNLVKGLGEGFKNFSKNIGKHLKTGLIKWLTGEMGPTRITIPEDVFSLKGIFSLVTQILGITWEFIRKKAVKLFGEPFVKALEKGAEIFQILIKEGPVGLWNYLKEQFSNLKEMVMDQIQDMLITQVIQAGVKWVLSLLNPVAAFIKAAIAIYDIVMFFVERAAQIFDFINSVIDAVAAIAKGQLSGAAKLVEMALAKAVPLIIGLLASLLGISGLAKKVQALVQKIRKKVETAIDGFLEKIRKSKIFQTISKKIKGLVKKGKAFAKKVKKKARAFAKKVKKLVKRPSKGRPKKAQEKRLSSKEVKAKVKAVLRGKVLTNSKQADSLLSDVYNDFQPKGLRGLKLIPDAKDPSKAKVLISASLADILDMRTKAEAIKPIAINMVTMSSTTSMYVFYDGNKPFPKNGKPYKNSIKSGHHRHAEEKFTAEIPKLIKLIDVRRKEGSIKTPVNQPVPVTIDINRLPCDHCAPLLTSVANTYSSQIKLTINAASVWKKETFATDLTKEESVRKMLEADIEIKPLHIWKTLETKLKNAGVKEILVNGKVYNLNEWAGTFEAHAYDVENKVQDALRHMNSQDKLKETQEGSVT